MIFTFSIIAFLHLTQKAVDLWALSYQSHSYFEPRIVKYAYVPLQFNRSSILNEDPRQPHYNWVRSWITVQTTDLDEIYAGDETILWTGNNSNVHAELIAMGILQQYLTTVKAVCKNAAVTSNTLLLVETIDLFPIGVFINVKDAGETRAITMQDAAQLMENIRFIVIANI